MYVWCFRRRGGGKETRDGQYIPVPKEWYQEGYNDLCSPEVLAGALVDVAPKRWYEGKASIINGVVANVQYLSRISRTTFLG